MPDEDDRLQTQQREWRKFTSILFHDLGPMVRRVDTYAHMLIKELEKEEQNPEELLSLAKSITMASGSLGDHLRAIREYGKVSNESLTWKEVALVEVWKELEWKFGESVGGNTQFQTEGAPSHIHADPQLLLSCLQKLLENAQISTSNEAKPEILLTATSVSSSTGHAELHIQVSDNGIGFLPRMKEKMFQLFGRIHKRDQYVHPGTRSRISYCPKNSRKIRRKPGCDRGSR